MNALREAQMLSASEAYMSMCNGVYCIMELPVVMHIFGISLTTLAKHIFKTIEYSHAMKIH